MSENNTVVVAEIVRDLPIKHQLGKIVFGTIVGFAASKLGEKAYEVTYHAIKDGKFSGLFRRK